MAANHTFAELQAMLNQFHAANPVEAAKLVLPAAVNQPWAVGGAVDFWTDDEWWEATVYETRPAPVEGVQELRVSFLDEEANDTGELSEWVLASSPLLKAHASPYEAQAPADGEGRQATEEEEEEEDAEPPRKKKKKTHQKKKKKKKLQPPLRAPTQTCSLGIAASRLSHFSLLCTGTAVLQGLWMTCR